MRVPSELGGFRCRAAGALREADGTWEEAGGVVDRLTARVPESQTPRPDGRSSGAAARLPALTLVSALETPRLVLPPWSDADADLLARLGGDPLVVRYIGAGERWSAERATDVSAQVVDHWRVNGFGWRPASRCHRSSTPLGAPESRCASTGCSSATSRRADAPQLNSPGEPDRSRPASAQVHRGRRSHREQHARIAQVAVQEQQRGRHEADRDGHDPGDSRERHGAIVTSMPPAERFPSGPRRPPAHPPCRTGGA